MSTNDSTFEDAFGPPISVYTRAQAIEDGTLVDVTQTAREAGFTCAVALTRTVWEQFIVPHDDVRPLGQSEKGRLWDVLFLLRYAVLRSRESSEVRFEVDFVMEDGVTRTATLNSVAGPGDGGEIVVTVMMPDED